VSIAIFGGVIALIASAHYVLKLNAVLSFWLAYIMTRPMVLDGHCWIRRSRGAERIVRISWALLRGEALPRWIAVASL
jgi:hypothetical protein